MEQSLVRSIPLVTNTVFISHEVRPSLSVIEATKKDTFGQGDFFLTLTGLGHKP